MFLLVAQYCEHGSLLSWIIENGSRAGMQTIINMCVDTASGMAYLSGIGIVHRDLAARNVLVASDLSCKVSDFGFARQTDEEGTLETSAKDQVAIRWAAPEAISERKYTTKSDVWSFGILLYEVYSFGKKPYEGWSNKRVLDELRGGFRLEKPMLCPPEVYELMVQTWHAVPDERPDFDMLRMELFSISSNTVDNARHSSVGKNKLIDRFNAKKDALRTTSANSENDEASQSSRRPRSNTVRSNKSGKSGKSVKSGKSGKRNDSVSERPHGSIYEKQRRGSMKQIGSEKEKDKKKKTGSSGGGFLRAALTRGNARIQEASYTDLLGKDDKVIKASTTIAVVPPVYVAPTSNAAPISQPVPDIQAEALAIESPKEQPPVASLDRAAPPVPSKAAVDSQSDPSAHPETTVPNAAPENVDVSPSS
jgi:serine/threonine protein kinase